VERTVARGTSFKVLLPSALPRMAVLRAYRGVYN